MYKEFEKMIDEKYERNREISFSEGINLFMLLLKISEFEKTDNKIIEFVSEVNENRKNIIEKLIVNKETKKENEKFISRLNEIYIYYKNIYFNIENIQEKKYTCECYLYILYIEHNKGILVLINKEEILYLISYTLSNYAQTKETQEINEKCVKLLYEVSVNKNYKYKQELIEIIKDTIKFNSIKRERFLNLKEDYDLYHDIIITIFGNIEIEYQKYFFKKYSTFNEIIEFYNKYFEISKYIEVIKSLEVEKECGICLSKKEEISKQLNDSIEEYYQELKGKKLVIGFIKRIKKETKEIEEHFEKDHNFFNTIKARKVLNIIQVLIIIVIMIALTLTLGKNQYIKKYLLIISSVAVIGFIFASHWFANIMLVKNLNNRKLL